MSHLMLLALTLGLFTTQAFANLKSETVVEENLYYDFQKAILNPSSHKALSLTGFTSFEQGLFVDALWDMVEEKNPQALKALNEVNEFHYDLSQKLRLGILRIKYNRAPYLPIELLNDLVSALQSPKVDLKLIYLLAAYETELVKAGHAELIDLAKNHKEYYDVKQDEDSIREITNDIVSDLYFKTPDVTTYMNGEYVKSIKIFMFCRNNRLYPCLMVMRNIHGEPVRLEDGTLWSNPALASSSRGLPSYQRNGNTPSGVLTIDSVMPSADQQISFGKFRRMILNFVPKSRDEVLLKSLLPESSHRDNWWRAGVVSRDVGRNLLRIHGTGKINQDKNTPYFPFMRTSGCIAQRENTYEGVTFRDQRDLLDSVMVAMDMAAVYDNEPKIKGLLYLIEIDDKQAPVSLEDLAMKGID
jgi:hypothetical protein